MKEVIKRYAGYGIAFLLLLIIAGNCINKTANKYIGEGNVYEKQLKNKVKILKKDSIRSSKIVDSLHILNKKKDNLIFDLKNKNIVLASKISVVVKKKEHTLQKVKTFTHKQDADFIASAYNKPESISYDSTGVTLKDDLSNKIVQTIVEKDACEEEAVYTKQMLSNSESEKKILNEKLENKDKELQTVTDFSKEQSSTLEASQIANESFKKQNKTLRTGRTIDKALIVAISVATFFVTKSNK